MLVVYYMQACRIVCFEVFFCDYFFGWHSVLSFIFISRMRRLSVYNWPGLKAGKCVPVEAKARLSFFSVNKIQFVVLYRVRNSYLCHLFVV